MLIVEYKGKRPQIAADAFVAPNATLIGDVVVGPGASVWFGAVLRGDSGAIRIGAGVSVQDNVVVHVNVREDTLIADEVIIGHGAVLEGCRVGRGALIGMNATVLSGSRVGAQAVIAAGAVVREGAEIPAGMLAAGVPAKIRREVPPAVLARMREAPDHYRENGRYYRESAVFEDTLS